MQKIHLKESNRELLTTLMELGLSHSESRVFMAMAISKAIVASEVSRISGVSRPDTYRALIGLVDRGLVEKVISKPAKYKPLSISEVVSILLERKEKENDTLAEKASKFLTLVNADKAEPTIRSLDNQFIFVPSHGAMDVEVDKLASRAQKEICVILTLNRLLPWLDRKTVHDALDRGIQLKAITEKPSVMPKEIVAAIKRLQVSFKFLSELPSVCFGIYDNREVLFTICVGRTYWKSPGIWSCNQGLIELARNYFYSSWSTALPLTDTTKR
jgi:sugar-specific transcriptional regulator TrmB